MLWPLKLKLALEKYWNQGLRGNPPQAHSRRRTFATGNLLRKTR